MLDDVPPLQSAEDSGSCLLTIPNAEVLIGPAETGTPEAWHHVMGIEQLSPFG